MATVTAVKSALQELQCAQELLQRAHDYVELHGFDIGTYRGNVYNNGASCFIGTVRIAAGLEGSPPLVDESGSRKADEGHGRGLTLALTVLDDLAKRKMSKQRSARVANSWKYPVGRYVESWVFDKDTGVSSEEALRVFRTALTTVYKRIEELGGEQH